MTTVSRLGDGDVDEVARRIAAGLAADATLEPMVNGDADPGAIAASLVASPDPVWVARRSREVVGHLCGTYLDAEPYGAGVWVPPDGASADDVDALADLYAAAGEGWVRDGALEHYAWVLDRPARTAPWIELGFARMHQRGVRRLGGGAAPGLPAGLAVREGGPGDLAAALALSAALDRAQALGPSFSAVVPGTDEAELAEALADPEVSHLLVERDGAAVAQCFTFALPTRRGAFADTVHLSGVSVAEGERGAGLGAALVGLALARARSAGFAYAETNWRVTNRGAARFWAARGFTPTYVRLHRTIGAG